VLAEHFGRFLQPTKGTYITQLLRATPEHRIPLTEVMVHPWIAEYARKRSGDLERPRV
jgi:hypothetical protein